MTGNHLSATLTVLALAMALAFPAHAQKAKAKKLFDKGVAAMEEHDYKGALESFEGAYKASPHWMVLAHLGNCHAKLNEPVKAIKAYEQYLREGGEDIPDDERAAARKNLAEQRKKVGVLHLLVKPKGTPVKIDGDDIGEAPFEEILLKAGPHHILAIRDDEEEERDISIYSGKELTVRMYPSDDSVAAVVGTGPATKPKPKPKPQPVEEPVEEPGEEPEPEPEPEPQPTQDGVLSVNANVDGATVDIDGEPMGEAPYEETVAPGSYQLSVGADGYLTWDDSVKVVGGQLNTVDVTLVGEDEKPERLSVPFWVATGFAGAGLITAGFGWGFFGYYKNSEGNYEDALKGIPNDPATNQPYNWNDYCADGFVSDNQAEIYYCDTEWKRRDYADKSKGALAAGITGTVVTVLAGSAAALFYFKPELFFGAESDAAITIAPIATSDGTSLVLGGTF